MGFKILNNILNLTPKDIPAKPIKLKKRGASLKNISDKALPKLLLVYIKLLTSSDVKGYKKEQTKIKTKKQRNIILKQFFGFIFKLAQKFSITYYTLFTKYSKICYDILKEFLVDM